LLFRGELFLFKLERRLAHFTRSNFLIQSARVLLWAPRELPGVGSCWHLHRSPAPSLDALSGPPTWTAPGSGTGLEQAPPHWRRPQSRPERMRLSPALDESQSGHASERRYAKLSGWFQLSEFRQLSRVPTAWPPAVEPLLLITKPVCATPTVAG
jgi:hypothetical protein